MEITIKIVEAIGMLFTMGGAYFMSVNSDKMKAHMLYAFILFGLSNIFMITIAIYHCMTALLIQMLLFTFTSYLGIKTYAPLHMSKENSALFLYIIKIIVLSSLGIILIYYYIWNSFTIKLTLPPIELLAAILAVYGSFLLRKKDLKIRSYSFLLFCVADILYVYIAQEKSMYFFMIQSAFFIYSSIKGYYQIKLQYYKIYLDNIVNNCPPDLSKY